jgi:hypothetical protein
MSAIHFEADLDNKKLEEAIKQSNKTVKDWTKDIEKAGVQADQGLNKMTKSFKDAIKEQKELIKTLENEVKKLQKAYDDADAGQRKSNLAVDLRSAKSSLVLQNDKLNKLQIEGNVQVEKSTDGLINKIGKIALAYISVKVVVKALSETVFAFFTKSQEGFELLERKTNGFKASLGVIRGEFVKFGKNLLGDKGDEAIPWGTNLIGSLKITLSNFGLLFPKLNGYFDDLTDRMNKASIAAENYTRMQQELEDAERDLIVPRAKANAEIVKARLLYADDSKSATERITALEKALKLEDETAQDEIKHQQWKILNIRDQNIELEKRGQLRDEDRKKLQEAIAEEINLQKESDQRQVRATRSLNTLRKELHDKEIEQVKELQKEYTNLAKVIKETDPGKGYSILNRYLKSKGVTPATGSELIKGGSDNLKLASGSADWEKKMREAIAKNDKEQIKILERQLELRVDIINSVMELTSRLSEAAGLDKETQQSLDDMLSLFSNMASGNYIGGIMSALSIVVNTLTEDIYHYSEEIERINGLLVEQQRLIDLSTRKGGTKEAIEAQLKILQEEKEYQQWYIKEQEKKLSGVSWRKAADNINKTTEALKETEIAIQEAQQALDDFLTGDITENTIADVIAQGFQEGKTSVNDFANYMNDVLTEAVLNIFKGELLGPAITDLTKQITTALSDKVLTSKEKQDIDSKIKEIADANRQLWNDLTGSLDFSETDSGISGQIQRSITEQTGTELAGLFRRFADDNRTTKDYTLLGLSNLTKIEANTYNTVLELQKAVVELQAINTNTKQVPVAAF